MYKFISFFLTIAIFGISSNQIIAQPNCKYEKKTIRFGNFPTDTISLTSGWVKSNIISDEFNFFDNTKWKQPGSQGHDMSLYAIFTANNVAVSDSVLVLSMQAENPPIPGMTWDVPSTLKDYYFSSGYIESKDSIRYGYIEARCFLPNTTIQHPCFWLFKGADSNYAEIDVFEKSDSSANILMQNVYRNIADTNTVSKVSQGIWFSEPPTNVWATFAVEWLPKEIVFYINGNVTSRLIHSDIASQINKNSIFTCANINNLRRQRIQLSYSLVDSITDLSLLDQKFKVDYIRCYKLEKGEDEFSSDTITDANISKVHGKIRLASSLDTSKNINFWANDEIVFEAGFEVSKTTPFTARVIETDPELFINYNSLISSETENQFNSK